MLQAGSCFLLCLKSFRSRSSALRLLRRSRATLQYKQNLNPATRAQSPCTRSPDQPRAMPAQDAAPGRSWRRRRGGAVAVSRAQVQQEPSAETSEGTGINITCSHPNIQADSIHWYRQFPGRGPAFLVSAVKVSKEVPDPAGRLWVSADRRSSALCLDRPRLGDAAVYYCAVDPRGGERGFRPGTNRGGRDGARSRPGPQGALPLLPPGPPRPSRPRRT
ncbi:uncharacterized protein LOC110391703 [Numida meleagris]|uniref:uncharacterized protein LOC110391703 n=1 Tax=Numida meleagris TaxID=8996 RepID=UPI000B3E285C|nr:uncharacterized protein LOC110391703 [Numida meleagris]